MTPPLMCRIKALPREQWIAAAARAVEINPANAPSAPLLRAAASGETVPPERIAVLTSRYWGIGGVRLTVGFLDNPPADLRARILSHMNAWGTWSNVQFTETVANPQVRIARDESDGNWSYHGTDILLIAPGEPTMNLGGFTMSTPDSEFYRVVRHETGHTLGFPHEHKRQEIVSRIDRDKAIQFFGGPPNNWPPEQVIEQVLTPLENSALVATAQTDINSIMCYWLPASIMKDGIAVTGGNDIDALDAQFAAQVYPLPIPAWPPPNLPAGFPPLTMWGVFLRIDTAAGPLPPPNYASDETAVIRGGEPLHRWHYSPGFGNGWHCWSWYVDEMAYHADGYSIRIRVPPVNGLPAFTLVVNPETEKVVTDPFWKGTRNPRPAGKPNYVRIAVRHPEAFVCHCAIALDAPGAPGVSDAVVTAGGVTLTPPNADLPPEQRYYRGTLPPGQPSLQVSHPRYRLPGATVIPATSSQLVQRITLVLT